MFDDIIMNLFKNKALNQHVELVDIHFTLIYNNKMNMYRGSLQEFYWRKGIHESPDFVRTHFNFGKTKCDNVCPIY